LHKVAKEESEIVVHLPAQVTTDHPLLKTLSVLPMGLGAKILIYYAKVRKLFSEMFHIHGFLM
jgi:hypothetical protein